MLITRVVTSVAFAALALAVPAAAVDGVFEIKQSCVAAGCFAGDTPGFPVQITSPGSYRLISNLQVPDENTTAIHVQAHDVTVDLDGFEISGVTVCDFANNTCAPTGSGVGVLANSFTGENAVVSNGTVRGMGSSGIAISGGGLVENVSALSNGWAGIQMTRGIVRSSVARLNRLFGVSCADCVASGNTANSNLGTGISAGSRALLIDNVITVNRSYGIEGVLHSPSYGRNLLGGNNGGDAQPQVEPGVGVQIGTNVCGTDTVCP